MLHKPMTARWEDRVGGDPLDKLKMFGTQGMLSGSGSGSQQNTGPWTRGPLGGGYGGFVRPQFGGFGGMFGRPQFGGFGGFGGFQNMYRPQFGGGFGGMYGGGGFQSMYRPQLFGGGMNRPRAFGYGGY